MKSVLGVSLLALLLTGCSFTNVQERLDGSYILISHSHKGVSNERILREYQEKAESVCGGKGYTLQTFDLSNPKTLVNTASAPIKAADSPEVTIQKLATQMGSIKLICNDLVQKTGIVKPEYKLNAKFTKLNSECEPLSFEATQWSAVLDNETGLIWEVKTTDDSIQNFEHRFKWGGVGVSDYRRTPKQFNEWDELVTYANNKKLCGYDDWRVPNNQELVSISSRQPGDIELFGSRAKHWVSSVTETQRLYIDPTYFPTAYYLRYPFYWSTDYYVYGGYGFSYQIGTVNGLESVSELPVRLVRGDKLVQKKQ